MRHLAYNWHSSALSANNPYKLISTGNQPRSKPQNERKEFARMAQFTPLHDRILVRRIEEGETTRGGIIIPDSAKEKPQEGEVISVGKGKSNDEGKVFPLAVKEGDRILFGKYSGTEIKLDGDDFIIMREEEVLGILTGAAKKELAGSRR
jgi:chaperonin GroES